MTFRIRIPAGNWHIHLADAIENATPDTVIVVSCKAQKELAEAASQRMGKSIVVEVGETEIASENTCPKCGGKVQSIGKGSNFCLDCDWDNLEAKKGHGQR